MADAVHICNQQPNNCSITEKDCLRAGPHAGHQGQGLPANCPAILDRAVRRTCLRFCPTCFRDSKLDPVPVFSAGSMHKCAVCRRRIFKNSGIVTTLVDLPIDGRNRYI